MMRRQVIASAAALALYMPFDGGDLAVAQEAGGGTSGTPQTTTPPATTSPAPPASQTTSPQTTTPPTTTPTPTTPGQTTAPGAQGTKLPEVQVIQEQPKPKPKPVKQAVKPKKTPTPVAAQAAPPPPAEAAAAPEGPSYAQPIESDMVKMSPIGGSEIPIGKVPTAVGRASAADIQRTGDVTVQNVLQSRVPGVIVSDLQGNDFQTGVQYRGFASSPVNGVPQGLAVYQNGVRINESFGDIVNWDFLPSNAIANMTVVGSNPVFGLNAIGGAITIDMRDGFNFHGAEFDVRGGSFGRIQGAAAVGAQSGNYAMFIAAEDINDDGWRQFSPSEIHRMYADLGFKNREAEFHVNFTGADNFVGAVTASPIQLLDLG